MSDVRHTAPESAPAPERARARPRRSRQRRRGARVLAAAITTALTVGMVGSSELVLCLAPDGHRAVETQHRGIGCPALATPDGGTGVSVESAAECVDLPAAGACAIARSPGDAARILLPAMVFLAIVRDPVTRPAARCPARSAARAGPPRLAPHLPSTVLLV